MFDQFDPAEDKMLQVIDNNGKVISKELMPKLSDDEMLKLYKDMLFVRTLDHMIVSYQRQGRVYTYPPNYGQEAIGVAAGAVLRHDDWLVPAFRELGAWLAKGVTVKEIFMFNMGFEEGMRFNDANHVLPFSVPIASQLLHGAGIGYAIKYQKKDEVAMAFVGDGGLRRGLPRGSQLRRCMESAGDLRGAEQPVRHLGAAGDADRKPQHSNQIKGIRNQGYQG
jgi:pyruvate dehydrogenase E1 component alpha subunit